VPTSKPLPTDFDSDALVSDSVTARLLNIHLATLRRMRRRGEGPRRIKISPRRYGTRLRDIGAYINSAPAA
jgi:hypothetical protein